MHGVHLHAVGKCEPDFAAAGGHFDPGPAGNTDPDANHPFHMGDIPNLEVGANGAGTMKVVTTRVTLSDGPLSLFDADGSAIIIHGNPDQGITGEPKSGVSGGPEGGLRRDHEVAFGVSDRTGRPDAACGAERAGRRLQCQRRCARGRAKCRDPASIISVASARASHDARTTAPNAPRSASGSAAVGCSISSSAGPSAIARARCARAFTAGGTLAGRLFQPLRRDVALLGEPPDPLARLRSGSDRSRA